MALDPRDNPGATDTILHQLPSEIFEKICGFLSPIWLINLAVSCYMMSVRLSLKSGNYLWFKSLPVTMWIRPEHYQDEHDLCSLWLSQKFPGLRFTNLPDIGKHQLVPT